MPARGDGEGRDPELLAGRYAQLAVLGEGAHGRVLGCEDRRLGRRVAVKLLRDRSGDSRAATRFRREAELAARLRHPHVVEVLDAGETEEGTLYLVQEWVEGESLRSRLEREGPPGEEVAREWSLQLLDALEAVHEAGVLHRDVKPENVMVREDETLVLADFGLGRDMGDRTRLTRSAEALGTPSTLAPELLAGVDSSPAADQYSLACVLYELHYGTVWRPGRTVFELLQRAGEPVPPLAREPRLGRLPGVDPVLHRALQPGPGARFFSVAVMAAAFRGEVPASTGRASPGALADSELRTAAYPARGRRPRTPVVVVAALLLGGLLLGYHALHGHDGEGARPPDPSAASPATPDLPDEEAQQALERAARAFASPYRQPEGVLDSPSDTEAAVVARAERILDPRQPLRLTRLLRAAGRFGEHPGAAAWPGWPEQVLRPLCWVVDDLYELERILQERLFAHVGTPEGRAMEETVGRAGALLAELRQALDRFLEEPSRHGPGELPAPWLAARGILAGRLTSVHARELLPVVEERLLIEDDPRHAVWLARAYARLLGTTDAGILPLGRRVESLRRVCHHLPAAHRLTGPRLETWGWVLLGAAEVLRQPGGGGEHPEALALFDRLAARLAEAGRREPGRWEAIRLRVLDALQVMRLLGEPPAPVRARIEGLGG